MKMLSLALISIAKAMVVPNMEEGAKISSPRIPKTVRFMITTTTQLPPTSTNFPGLEMEDSSESSMDDSISSQASLEDSNSSDESSLSFFGASSSSSSDQSSIVSDSSRTTVKTSNLARKNTLPDNNAAFHNRRFSKSGTGSEVIDQAIRNYRSVMHSPRTKKVSTNSLLNGENTETRALEAFITTLENPSVNLDDSESSIKSSDDSSTSDSPVMQEVSPESSTASSNHSSSSNSSTTLENSSDSSTSSINDSSTSGSPKIQEDSSESSNGSATIKPNMEAPSAKEDESHSSHSPVWEKTRIFDSSFNQFESQTSPASESVVPEAKDDVSKSSQKHPKEKPKYKPPKAFNEDGSVSSQSNANQRRRRPKSPTADEASLYVASDRYYDDDDTISTHEDFGSGPWINQESDGLAIGQLNLNNRRWRLRNTMRYRMSEDNIHPSHVSPSEVFPAAYGNDA